MKPHILGALALCLACQAEAADDGPEAGEHIVVSAEPGLQLCGGSVAFMDEFIARVAAEFSIPAPSGAGRIRFHWLESHEFVASSGCPAFLRGCARGLETFSRSAPHNHEIVHNLASAIGGPPAFFGEGLAVAYQGFDGELLLGGGGGGVGSSAAIREALTAPTIQLVTDDLYPLAGSFTAFLIRRHGIEAYLRLYAELRADADLEEIDRVFSESLGAPLEESLAAFEADPYCPHANYGAKLIECSAPALAWDGRALQMSRTLACEDADVVGPFHTGSAVVYYTIDIPERGLYELRVVGDEFEPGTNPSVALHPCEGPCWPVVFVAEARQAPHIGWLDPGRHTLRLHGPADAPTVVGFQLLRVDANES